MVEHLLCKQGVAGSNPANSTFFTSCDDLRQPIAARPGRFSFGRAPRVKKFFDMM